MRLLLDTHVYLWWLSGDARLTAAARGAIADPVSVVHVSAASVWEAAIKAALGRLEVGQTDLAAEITANGFAELPVTAAHAWRVWGLPTHRTDPFDRLLVAQALTERLVLVTRDPAMQAYDVETLEI